MARQTQSQADVAEAAAVARYRSARIFYAVARDAARRADAMARLDAATRTMRP